MTTSKKYRAAKKLSRPAADASCTITRTVERQGVRLEVWSCAAPTEAIRWFARSWSRP